MRTRHSLTAAVVALVAILVGIIISLLAGGGPDAHAEEPGPAPSVGTPAPPPDPGTTAGGVTGDDSTATLTVTVNGATTTRSYRAGTDRSFTESVDVPLRGVSACRITVRSRSTARTAT